MVKRIAALSCCLSLVQGSVVTAEEALKTRPAPVTAAVVNAVPEARPLLRASLSNGTQLMLRAEPGWAARPIQNADNDKGSWMKRHPVWTGAMVGFSTGFLLTYASTYNDRHDFIKIMSPSAGATIWGGVSAGVGALVGWGIGRNLDEDGYHDRGGSASTTGRQ
jgi:hypothetical protein